MNKIFKYSSAAQYMHSFARLGLTERDVNYGRQKSFVEWFAVILCTTAPPRTRGGGKKNDTVVDSIQKHDLYCV